MPKQKKSNDVLLYIINLLSKKREELINPFLKADYELIGQTFKYERNQSAFNLVRECYFTLWVDSHFLQLISDEIPIETRQKCLALLSELLNSKSGAIDDSEIKHHILSTKAKVIKKLLYEEDQNNLKLNQLRYSYEKDKALFEREFQKYERQINESTK